MVFNCFENNKEFGGYSGYNFINCHYARLHYDKIGVCK